MLVSQCPPKPARQPVTPAGLSAAQAARSVAEVNDLVGDTEGLFAAYLAKPVRQSQLFATLTNLFVHTTQPKEATPAKARIDAQVAARHPLRILLAEDNVVNQKPALRLLQQMGCRAGLASNGVEASRRNVAMTANAMQGDREMCQRADMDDDITKPIHVEQLVEALNQALPRGVT